ncbi:MAG: antibiotic biosynthesis monooxygenase family protein [Candidatus Odinarchaeota archaeon]
MAVQVLIRRKFIKEKAEEVAPLMVALRSLARAQPGYISSESLRCIDPECDDEYLIRSTWHCHEDWKRWLGSDKRKAIQARIDAIAGVKTEYRVYEVLVGGIFP